MKRMSRLRRFRSDTSGAAIIIAALMMPVLVGGMGLGAEAGYRYFNQRMLQHAADVAAHAGATRKRHAKGTAEEVQEDLEAAALNVATQSGFTPALAPDDIIVNNPPKSGAHINNHRAVEVILREARPRLFSAIFVDDPAGNPVSVGARAVAALQAGSSGCVLALSKTKADAVLLTGATNVTLNGCSIAVNSTSQNAFTMQGNGAHLTGECVDVVGGGTGNNNLTLSGCGGKINGGAPAADDPYADAPTPPDVGCANSNPRDLSAPPTKKQQVIIDGTMMDVFVFCEGMNVRNDVKLPPGLYIIKAGSKSNEKSMTTGGNVKLSGEGVTFFLTNGARLDLAANVVLDLSAPVSPPKPAPPHPYEGILFFGDRNDSGVTHLVRGTPNSTLRGAIYMPAGHVDFSGNFTGAGGCTQVIADTVKLTGSSLLQADCSQYGYREIDMGLGIALVE